MATNPHSSRKSISKDTSKQVIVFMPKEVVDKIDAAARASDTDRSKWIRQAVRNALR